jgi:hypothetical protein
MICIELGLGVVINDLLSLGLARGSAPSGFVKAGVVLFSRLATLINENPREGADASLSGPHLHQSGCNEECVNLAKISQELKPVHWVLLQSARYFNAPPVQAW